MVKTQYEWERTRYSAFLVFAFVYSSNDVPLPFLVFLFFYFLTADNNKEISNLSNPYQLPGIPYLLMGEEKCVFFQNPY